MEPFDEAWMQNISLIMYLIILANMVRLWLTFTYMRQELDEVFGMIQDVHHHMGLCDCGDPSVKHILALLRILRISLIRRPSEIGMRVDYDR